MKFGLKGQYVHIQNAKFHIKNVKLRMKKVDWAQRAHCAHGPANMHACQNMKFHFENMKFHVKKNGPKEPQGVHGISEVLYIY